MDRGTAFRRRLVEEWLSPAKGARLEIEWAVHPVPGVRIPPLPPLSFSLLSLSTSLGFVSIPLMNPLIFTSLSVMMFLQFFIWGSWYVTAPNYLGTIGFGAEHFKWTYSVGPIAGMISPFFVGFVADRFFPAQRVLGVMHLLGAAFMYFAITLMQAAEPDPTLINWVFFLHMLTYFPTLALTNSLAMKNMTSPDKEFPFIRVFGTIGWIVAGITLSALKYDTSVNMFHLTVGAGALLGVFSFFLPNTPPSGTGKVTAGQLLGLDAMVLFKKKEYLIFLVCSALICIPLAFYYQIASRVVEMVGLPIGQTMSYGQMSEIFFMLVMPLFFVRLGVKWMLAVGMLAWVVRYALFAFGASSEVQWMIIVGIVLYGICYDFFFVTGQIYTDKKAPSHIRSQAQGLLVLFTLGLGMLIGAQVAGVIEGKFTTDESKAKKALVTLKVEEIATATEAGADEATLQALNDEKNTLRKEELAAIEWKPLWLAPAAFAGLVMLIFIATFKDEEVEKKAVKGAKSALIED